LWTQEKASEEALFPSVEFQKCPIRTSLGVLGKKWTFLILRDIAFLKVDRFNKILRTLPGLTPRVLITRLHELEKSGLIKAVVIQKRPRLVKWELTEQGKDTVPILLSFIAYGAKWFPDVVFEDGQARTVKQLFPNLAPVNIA